MLETLSNLFSGLTGAFSGNQNIGPVVDGSQYASMKQGADLGNWFERNQSWLKPAATIGVGLWQSGIKAKAEEKALAEAEAQQMALLQQKQAHEMAMLQAKLAAGGGGGGGSGPPPVTAQDRAMAIGQQSDRQLQALNMLAQNIRGAYR